MWQANWVARHLAEHLPDADIEIVEITTRGDRTSDLAGLVGMGHFTSELEAALLDDRIDVAVHSLKDLPVEDTSGVTIAAIPTREEPSDVVVARAGVRFDDLPAGARPRVLPQRSDDRGAESGAALLGGALVRHADVPGRCTQFYKILHQLS